MHQAPMSAFTLFHVLLSLVGIVSGLFLLLGFFVGRLPRVVTGTFLLTTIATSVTGFFFPFKGITPGIILGVVSLVVLALAVVAYQKLWTKTFVLSCALAEFLNVLVLIVQSFQKISPLHVFAPKGTEPVVAVCQLAALVVITVWAVIAIRRHRFTLSAAR